MRRIPLVALVVTALVCWTAVPASASTPSASAAATWQTNGIVYALAYSGDSVYIGGSFTAVRPPGSSTTSVVRNNVAAFSLSTGALLSWDPEADRYVRAIVVGPDGTVYLGGAFNSIRGVARSKLAAVTPDTGAPTAWKANASSLVRGLAISADGTQLYAGGDFSSINGVSRLCAAAVSLSTGAVVSGWRADMTAGANFTNVTTISVAGTTVYLGGNFGAVNGVSRLNTAAVDSTSGGVLAWKPYTPVTILGITHDSTRVFVVGRGAGGFLRAFSASTGSLLWNSQANGDVQAVNLRGSELYVGGHFTSVLNITRNHLAALDSGTGGVLAWNPNVNDNTGVEAIATDSSHLSAGGDFTFIGGRWQQDYAEFLG